MFVGAVVGLVLCSIGAAAGLIDWMETLSGEDFASVLLALLMLFLAGFAVLVSSSERAYRAIAENYREGDPVDANVLRTMRISAVIMASRTRGIGSRARARATAGTASA